MRNFDVPQYIDVEDKIAFQLTAKQLGWFGLGGVLLFFAWNYATREFFIFWSIVIVLASTAMAFLRPYGITLASFIGFGFMHVVRPKQYVWQRAVNVNPGDLNQIKATKKVKTGPTDEEKLQQVDKLANLLDSKRIVR